MRANGKLSLRKAVETAALWKHQETNLEPTPLPRCSHRAWKTLRVSHSSHSLDYYLPTVRSVTDVLAHFVNHVLALDNWTKSTTLP